MQDALKSDTAKLIESFMIGIACLAALVIVLAGVIGIPYMIAQNNNEKVRELTNVCIEQGYDGWADETDDGKDTSGCYND